MSGQADSAVQDRERRHAGDLAGAPASARAGDATGAAPRATVEVTRVYHFSSAHRLSSPALGAADNARLYGACARPHGHNYYVEVTLAGVPDALTGMAVDIGRLDRVVDETLISAVDHHSLEEVQALAGVITTGESLARAFWRMIAPAVAPATLTRVVVHETAKNRFEYRGPES